MEKGRKGAALLSFKFHSEDESISCNHRYLTKGVPALILRHILAAYSAEGRSYFEYREFKRDRSLFPTPKATNFEVRFRRLISLLDERVPDVILESAGPGRFHVRLQDPRTVIAIAGGETYPVSEMSIAGKRNVSIP